MKKVVNGFTKCEHVCAQLNAVRVKKGRKENTKPYPIQSEWRFFFFTPDIRSICYLW